MTEQPGTGKPDSDRRIDDQVSPEQTSDDTDLGWGEHRAPDDDEQLIREKPPHY